MITVAATVALVALVALFGVTGGLAITQHGRQIPTRRFNAFPVLGMLAVEMLLVAIVAGAWS